jgi:hypothetical protein
MSKKKTLNRKHKFKYSEPAAPAVSGDGLAGAPASSRSPGALAGVGAAAVQAHAYVKRDVRRILVLAVILIALELVVWYALGHFSFLKPLT